MNRHEIRHPPARCPNCGHLNDAATQTSAKADGDPPRKGDVAVCISCAGISIVEKVAKSGRPVMRKATSSEKRDIHAAEPNVARIQAQIIALARRSGRELADGPPVASPAPSRTVH